MNFKISNFLNMNYEIIRVDTKYADFKKKSSWRFLGEAAKLSLNWSKENLGNFAVSRHQLHPHLNIELNLELTRSWNNDFDRNIAWEKSLII